MQSITLREKVILGALVALLAGGAAWRVWKVPAQEREIVFAEKRSAAPAAEPEMLVVHLVGCVANPGVYRLPAGSRVCDLLALAGGAPAEADLERVNLARPLYDGEQVIICRTGEAADPVQDKININRATAAELTALPGIGETRARQIVEHRDQNGFFADITQIMEVSGIGEGLFSTIKDLITIY